MATQTRRSRGASAPQNRRPKPTDAELRERGFVPFLRPEHTKDGAWLKLTGFNSVADAGTTREQFKCEVEDEHGSNFTLGVRVGSPDHRVLHRALGKDYKHWSGSVQVKIVPGRKNADVSFVNVASADTEPPFWSDAEPADAE